MIVLLFFWEYGQRLVEYGQAIDPQDLSLSGHPLLQKARTFRLRPARLNKHNKHNRFQYTVQFHTKSCMAHSRGERGVRGKKPGFCNGRHMAKTAQIQ